MASYEAWMHRELMESEFNIQLDMKVHEKFFFKTDGIHLKCKSNRFELITSSL